MEGDCQDVSGQSGTHFRKKTLASLKRINVLFVDDIFRKAILNNGVCQIAVPALIVIVYVLAVEIIKVDGMFFFTPLPDGIAES